MQRALCRAHLRVRAPPITTKPCHAATALSNPPNPPDPPILPPVSARCRPPCLCRQTPAARRLRRSRSRPACGGKGGALTSRRWCVGARLPEALPPSLPTSSQAQSMSCCSLKERPLPVATNQAPSIAPVAANAQQLPHCACEGAGGGVGRSGLGGARGRRRGRLAARRVSGFRRRTADVSPPPHPPPPLHPGPCCEVLSPTRRSTVNFPACLLAPP